MRKMALLDIIFYMVIPLVLWIYGRDLLGDYYAMLLSTVPGVIYTIYRFIKQKQINISGLFIMSSLILTAAVNVLSSTAESMLWNQVYLGYFFASVFLFSMIIKKPLALSFAVDIAFLQGYDRENSRALFFSKGLFVWFQLFTCLFVFRGIFQNTFKAWLISTYGVDGYAQMIIYLNVTGWIFNALIFVAFIFVSSKINQYKNTNGLSSN